METRLLTMLIVCVTTRGNAVASAPATYLVEYRPSFPRRDLGKETHLVQGDRIRIERRSTAPGNNELLTRHEYTRYGQLFSYSITPMTRGRVVALSLMDDPLSAPPVMARRRWTGQQERHLEQTCRVWTVSDVISRDTRFVRSGCLATTGVELWRRNGAWDKIVATDIRRVTVPRILMLPPAVPLDTAYLIRDEAGSDHRHDIRCRYAAVMTGG